MGRAGTIGEAPLVGMGASEVRARMRRLARRVRERAGPLARYGVAVAAVAAAVGLKWIFFGAASREVPFVFLFVATVFAAWFGGRGPAIVAVALVALAATTFFLPPFGRSGVTGRALAHLCVFVGEASATGALTVALTEARARAEAAAETLRGAEVELLRANRALRALGVCNEILVRARDEAKLLDQICRTIVEVAGYRMCWVGHAEHDASRSVRPVAHAGHEAGYLATADFTWADVEPGRGPTGTAIRSGHPCIVQDTATAPSIAHWRAQALERGYRSSLALPLRTNGDVYGALSIYAGEPNAFNADEVRLLAQLAGDLGYGIGALRARSREEISARRLALMQAATSSFAAAATCADVANIVARQVGDVLGATRACVFVTAKEPDTLCLVAHSGLDEQVAERMREIPADHASPMARALRTGEVACIESAAQMPAGFCVLPEDGRPTAALMCAPMVVQGSAIGLVVLGFAEAHTFDAAERAATLTLARECGLALERVRLYAAEERALAAADAERRRFESVLLQAPIAVAVCAGPDHVVRLVNERWLALGDRGRESTIGRPLGDLLMESNRRRVTALLDEVFSTGEPRDVSEYPLEVRRSAGGLETRFYSSACAPLRAADGTITDVIVVVSEVSEQVAARRVVEETSRARDEFVRIASHELRTPLTTLRMMLSLLGESGSTRSAHEEEMLRTALAGCDQLGQTVDAMLELAHAETGNIRLRRERFTVAALAKETLASLSTRARDAEVSMPIRDESNGAAVEGDIARLFVVLSNVVSNALKYSPPESVIDVCLRDAGESVEVAVTDQGPGVPAEYRERIFEKYFRVEHQKDGGEPLHGPRGAGMGLYLCRQIVEAHGGAIGCTEGAGGKGTTITLSLPKKRESGRDLLPRDSRETLEPQRISAFA